MASAAGGMEAAMHATGNYPEWWNGRRFDGPTVAWVAGETAETVRDTVQRITSEWKVLRGDLPLFPGG